MISICVKVYMTAHDDVHNTVYCKLFEVEKFCGCKTEM